MSRCVDQIETPGLKLKPDKNLLLSILFYFYAVAKTAVHVDISELSELATRITTAVKLWQTSAAKYCPQTSCAACLDVYTVTNVHTFKSYVEIKSKSLVDAPGCY